MARIVVGVDGSDQSCEALRWARDEARMRQATLEAVCSFHLPSGWLGMGGTTGATMATPPAVDELSDHAGEILRQIVPAVCGQDDGVEVVMRSVPGHPGEVLVEASEGADLLVVGTRGHGDIGSVLLGSVATHCAHHAHCPVVVVRPTAN